MGLFTNPQYLLAGEWKSECYIIEYGVFKDLRLLGKQRYSRANAADLRRDRIVDRYGRAWKRRVQSAQQREQRTLSASTLADERDPLPLADPHRQVKKARRCL